MLTGEVGELSGELTRGICADAIDAVDTVRRGGRGGAIRELGAVWDPGISGSRRIDGAGEDNVGDWVVSRRGGSGGGGRELGAVCEIGTSPSGASGAISVGICSVEAISLLRVS